MTPRHAAWVRRATYLVGLLLVVSACSLLPQQSEAASSVATVTRVYDGDTVEVSFGGRRESVRLIGIDTPEIAHPPNAAECYGPEASAYLHSLLPPGTEVIVTRDVEPRDAYDRLLGYVTRSQDDLFINMALVQGGYAELLTIAPNTIQTAAFAGAASTANATGIGLWGACS